MRKLKLQVQISVDGFIAGPKGEMDWSVWDWDDELKRYVTELTSSFDTIILGRKLAEGFIPHWTKLTQDPDDPEYAAARIFVDTPKVVFTKSIEQSAWENTILAKGDLAGEIAHLKEQDGADIITYGGGTLASALIKEDLIDEYHLFVNPAVLGDGLAIFREVASRRNLSLVESIPFDCGIVVLHYEPTAGERLNSNL